MKIDKIEDSNSLQRMRQAYLRAPTAGPSTTSDDKTSNVADKKRNTRTQGDQVTISPLSVQLSNIKKAVEADPTVREERVASLRAAIQSGEYKVSDEKLAEKIIEHLIG